jgi:hypothetical protein
MKSPPVSASHLHFDRTLSRHSLKIENFDPDLDSFESSPSPLHHGSLLVTDTHQRIVRENHILDAREIIEEMKQSCETAICTLNDVLLYDKIEEGTIIFEKRKICVRQLLAQTIKPFFIQVTLLHTYTHTLLPLTPSLPRLAPMTSS